MEKCEICVVGIRVEGRMSCVLAYESDPEFAGIAFLYCPMCGNRNKQFEEGNDETIKP